MASIGKDRNGSRRILYIDPRSRQRKTITLGKCSKQTASEVKIRLTALLSSLALGTPLDPGVAAWLGRLTDAFYEKLVSLDLAPPRQAAPSAALGPFIQGYIDSRVDLKERSKWMLRQAQQSLIAYFGADKALRDISAADSELWRLAMIAQGLADATVRKRCAHAKQFIARARRQKLVESDPFAALPSSSRPNPSRMVFVSQADIEKVLAVCPDLQWKLIFALCRYGGLRCPSEVLELRWRDVLWDQGRMLVRSVKTERHEGKESRLVPIFGELRPYLLAAFEEAEPGDMYVIMRYRQASANLRTQAHRIIQRAGLKCWTRTFQNLRSSRETELTETFPLHVVTSWLGNSALIASKHYLGVRDSDFEKAATCAQNPTHALHAPRAESGTEQKVTCSEEAENGDMLVGAGAGDTLRESPIAPRGFEPLSPG